MALNVTRPLGSVQTSDYNTWRYLPYVDLACDLDAVLSVVTRDRVLILTDPKVGSTERYLLADPASSLDPVRGLLRSLSGASVALAGLGWEIRSIERRSGARRERIELWAGRFWYAPVPEHSAFTWALPLVVVPGEQGETASLTLVIARHPLLKHSALPTTLPSDWSRADNDGEVALTSNLSKDLLTDIAVTFAPAIEVWARAGWSKANGLCGPILATSWSAWFTGDPDQCNRVRSAVVGALPTPSASDPSPALEVRHLTEPIGRALSDDPCWASVWRRCNPREPLHSFRRWLNADNPTLLRVMLRLHLNGVLDLAAPGLFEAPPTTPSVPVTYNDLVFAQAGLLRAKTEETKDAWTKHMRSVLAGIRAAAQQEV